jgi:hypothetical protein
MGPSLAAKGDAGGDYTFQTSDIPCHNVILVVTSPGYQTATSEVECTDQLQRIDFALSPPP